jgi:hypothetical protein
MSRQDRCPFASRQIPHDEIPCVFAQELFCSTFRLFEVYRAVINVKAGQIIGNQAGVSNGPAGIDVVDEAWAGQLVVETEGTTERASIELSVFQTEV